MRVLLVEDEPEMAAALGAALKKYDMVVDHFSTLADAEEAIGVPGQSVYTKFMVRNWSMMFRICRRSSRFHAADAF